MNREEAIAAGMDVHEIQHSMKRRTPWHDYSRKGTYMLTLVVRERAPLLGALRFSEKVAGMSVTERAYVELSALGTAIVEEEQKKIHHFYPQVDVWKLCIMPDHLHMIVRVNEDMGEGKHLGNIVAGFKGDCSKAAMRLGVTVHCASAQEINQSGHSGDSSCGHSGDSSCGRSGDSSSNVVPLFEKGYCDKILMHEGQLDNWKRYLDDNPRRLMMKRQNPELFTVLTGMKVAGEECQVVGNRFLLDIPDKMAVIVHRHNTDEENARLRKEWLACGERGGVLVSAAISPKEKEVLHEAMNRGYNIILLRENGFPKLYKPSGVAFDACAGGILLQISPWTFHMEKKMITRAQCLNLNSLAERIASNG